MSNNSPLHLVIATGGTGGHIFPALAVAEEVNRRGGMVSLVVAAHRVIQEQYSVEHPGFATHSINAARLPSNKTKFPLFCVHFVHAWFQARGVLRRIQPDVVLGMGSFASVPASLAAVTGRTPLFLHEGNALIGKANRLLCRWAQHVATSLPLAGKTPRHCSLSNTGFPVRRSFRQALSKPAAQAGLRRDFGLKTDPLTILVFGGSQGAQPINEIMLSVPPLLTSGGLGCQFIHLTGTEQNAATKAQYANAGFPHWVSGWTDKMAACYQAADVVVCRAGASTLAELALAGKPAVLIPLPSAANDHQTVNARVLSDRDAAVLLPQKDATPEALAAVLRSVVDAPDMWDKRVDNLKALAHPRAAEHLVDLITDACSEDMSIPPANQ